MKYEAVVLDIGNEQIYRQTGDNLSAVVMSVIEESCESYDDEFKMDEEELHNGYRFAKTNDSRMENLFTFSQAVDMIKAGTVSLLVIVSWDHLLAPIGFFRKL